MSDAREQLLATIEDAVADTLGRQLAGIVDELAERVADRLAAKGGPEPYLVHAAEVARRFGVSRDYVYSHSGALGAIQLPSDSEATDPRPRLRFDLGKVAEALQQDETSEPEPEPTRRRQTRPRSTADLLPIRGRRP